MRACLFAYVGMCLMCDVVLCASADPELFLSRDVTVEADVLLAHAEREADELLQVQDGDLDGRLDGVASLRLIHVELHLAERARRDDEVSTGAAGAVDDLACHRQHVVLGGELRVEAAALAVRVEPDRRATEAADEALEGLRVLAVLMVHDVLRAQDVAAVIGSDLRALQGVRDLALEELRMIVEDPEEMRDLARALVLVRMARFLEDGVDLVPEVLVVVEAVLGRAQLQRAGVADRQDWQAHVLGNRDVAGIDGKRCEVVDALRMRGAAARPVRDLLELDAERIAYLLHGGIGFGCGPLEDTAREKCKFHRLLLLFLCHFDDGSDGLDFRIDRVRLQGIHLADAHEAQGHRSAQAGQEEALRLDVELRLVECARLLDVIVDGLRMARADIVVEVVLEGRGLELLDSAGRVEVLRALRRALLAVEAAPEAGVEDGLEVLFRILVARVRRDALRLDEGKRIEEVLLVQRVLVAFRDARAAEDAAGVFLVFVKISRRLAAAILRAELVLRVHDGLDLLDARVLRVPVDDEVADDAEVAERLDRQGLGLVARDEVRDELLARELGVAVDAHGAGAADARAAGASEGKRRVLMLLDADQCLEDRHAFRDLNLVVLHPLAPFYEAMDSQCSHDQYFLSFGSYFVTTTSLYSKRYLPSSLKTSVCLRKFWSSRFG